MRVREFSAELWLPLPPEELFPFFADARQAQPRQSTRQRIAQP